MEWLRPWLGNLYEIEGLSHELIGVACVVASAVCGAVIGMDRERRHKPAGLRTLVLIALGSTVFTIVSLLLSERKDMADPARLAAQIIPGVGFLGAGAIMQSRGGVVGLTTGATIWTVAAIGVTIGAGYVAAGLVFTAMAFLTLTTLHGLEALIAGPCRFEALTIHFRTERGKTEPRLRAILDTHPETGEPGPVRLTADGEGILHTRICRAHREHRVVLREIAELEPVLAIERSGGGEAAGS